MYVLKQRRDCVTYPENDEFDNDVENFEEKYPMNVIMNHFVFVSSHSEGQIS